VHPFYAGCRAPAVVGARVETRLWQLARLVLASCFNALLPRMSVHAAGPPDLEGEQAISVPAKGTEQGSPQAFPMEFLDRLMAAESGGHLHKKNPRSTALGPFQFIESTFLVVVNKHFPHEVAGLTKRQILARRTEMVFSRRAARAYAANLISALKMNALPATTRNVRIAFLVGPSAAVRLWGATVAKLVRKAAGDVSATAAPRRPSPSLGEPAVTAAVLKDEAATATTLKGEAEGGTAVALARLLGGAERWP
jgi:hypothetical protein